MFTRRLALLLPSDYASSRCVHIVYHKFREKSHDDMKRFHLILRMTWFGVGAVFYKAWGCSFVYFSLVLPITIQNRPKGRRTKSAMDLDFQPRLIGLTLFN